MSDSNTTNDSDNKNKGIEKYTPARNEDGTFAKGYTGFPGGAMRLSQGQKIVRDFAIRMLPEILDKFREFFISDFTPIELRIRIGEILIARGAGKVPEAPAEDYGTDGGAKNMTGAQLLAMVQFIKQNQHLFGIREKEPE